jgi:hypothetical protein
MIFMATMGTDNLDTAALRVVRPTEAASVRPTDSFLVEVQPNDVHAPTIVVQVVEDVGERGRLTPCPVMTSS